MSNKNKVLSDSEINGLKSMSLYWREVRGRDDASPLVSEAIEVRSMLGIKLLNLVEHYLELLDKEEVEK